MKRIRKYLLFGAAILLLVAGVLLIAHRFAGKEDVPSMEEEDLLAYLTEFRQSEEPTETPDLAWPTEEPHT